MGKGQTLKTGIIRFNLKDTMRRHTGRSRNFDIPKLIKVINSEAVQERVRLGDLNGFYGHLARIQFGAEPKEGGIVGGKMVYLEPCCRTVYLRAFDDGFVEHQQEFFDTELGRKVYQRWKAKSGGFSSVISNINGYNFHGLDYVNEPNFSENRGYTLDDAAAVESAEIFLLDDIEVNALQHQLADFMDCVSIYQETNEKLTQENKLLSESLTKLHAEHNVLLDDLVILQEKIEAEKHRSDAFARSALATATSEKLDLDSAITEAERFKYARLEHLEDEYQEKQTSGQKNKLDRIMGRYGFSNFAG